MIGWHYTSKTCWERIRHEGLLPYSVRSEIVAVGAPDKGIWLYTERQHGLSHLGCLLWQMRAKKSCRLVLLEVRYSESDRVFVQKCWKGERERTLSVSHKLDDDAFVFHESAPATVVWCPVPSRRIKLAASYDLVELADPTISLPLATSTMELQLTQ